MIPTRHLLEYAIASVAITVVPGPRVVFVVGRALAHGRPVAVASVAGSAVGNYLVAVAVAFGLGAIVAGSDVLFAVVKYAGSAYLVWLGVQAVRHRRDLPAALHRDAGGAGGSGRALRQGVLVGVTNPKALILFGAVLPHFLDRSPTAGSPIVQILLLAVVSVLIGLASDTCWALIASSARAWFARSPRRLAFVGGAGGVAMIGVGLSVAITGRTD